MNLLGLDIGTTSLKAALFDEAGERLDFYCEDYALDLAGGRVEFDAEEYVNIARRAVAAIGKNHKIDAIAADTQGETLILCGEDGKPLCPAVVWLDTRATEEAALIEKAFGREKVYAVTGQPEITGGWPACKLLWFRRNRPDVFARIKKVFLLEDYIIYRLCGQFVTEPTIQSSSVYFDITKKDYFDDMLDFIGVSREVLPRVVKSGKLVGQTENGINVVTGALDQIAGAVGAGVAGIGRISEMTGTTMAVCAPSESIPPYDAGSIIPCHLDAAGGYVQLLWSPTAGMALKWYRNTFCPELSFRQLDEEAAKAPVGCDGLTLLPYFCGSTMPRYDPDARAAFCGATLSHTRGHFARAILESVAFILRENLEYIGADCSEIRIMGGGASSPLWAQIKADVTGKRLCTLRENETACLGSALLAGVGIGAYDSLAEAAERAVKTAAVYEPGKDDYTAAYENYKYYNEKLYGAGCAKRNITKGNTKA